MRICVTYLTLDLQIRQQPLTHGNVVVVVVVAVDPLMRCRIPFIDDAQVDPVFIARVSEDDVAREGEAGDHQFEGEGHEERRGVVDLQRGQEGEMEVGRVREVEMELERWDGVGLGVGGGGRWDGSVGTDRWRMG